MTATVVKIGIGIGLIILLSIIMILIIRSKIKSANSMMAGVVNTNTRSIFIDTGHRIGKVIADMISTLITIAIVLGMFGGIIWLIASMLSTVQPPVQKIKEPKETESMQVHRILQKEDPVISNRDIGQLDKPRVSKNSQQTAEKNISLASQGYYTNNTYHMYMKFNMSKHGMEMQMHNRLIYIHNMTAYLGQYGGIIIDGTQSNGNHISLLVLFNRNNNRIAINTQGAKTKVEEPKIIRGYSERDASKLASSHLIGDPQSTFKYTPQA